MIEPSENSGPQILHHCHCGIEGGLQGTLSDNVLTLFAVVSAESDQQTLLPSPRNSIEGHLALLESTDCNIFISPIETKVDHILSRRNMRHLNVEALNELLRDDFIEQYEYNKTFEEASHDPFIIVHTSGSTGLPKPIILYHGGVTQVDSQHLLSSLDGFEPQIRFPEASTRVFSSLPPFHVGLSSSNHLVPYRRHETNKFLGSGDHPGSSLRFILRADDYLATDWSANQC